ncbi:hypothetical protein CQ059_09685 [Brucella pseudogrignonensis]|nr:hypothetical protein CQ059_09685 [Brucella pseudogrignonensis]PRA38239.1 hypothetical protein CQ063_18820 [Brucella pseudogrignonensis]PRA64082.1 hypothetical protein CQ055_18710 [Brucella pseudogrignonensis]
MTDQTKTRPERSAFFLLYEAHTKLDGIRNYGEPKMVGFENRRAAYLTYVSTGSEKSRHLQATPASAQKSEMIFGKHDA